jgi:type II secretory pathway pseudopilin PulG
MRNRCRGIALAALAISLFAAMSSRADAQAESRDGWVEEPATRSLNVAGAHGRAYLDSASVYRGNDGLVYFNESADVTRPEDIGKVGLMKDAYDCAKNLKYMCVEAGNWRNDTKSTVDAAHDPAFQVYRKYLCGDANSAADDSADISKSGAR